MLAAAAALAFKAFKNAVPPQFSSKGRFARYVIPGASRGVRVLKMLTGFATGPQGLVLLVIASGIGNAGSTPSASSDLAIDSNVVNASTVIFWAFGAAVVAEIQPRPCLAAQCKPPSAALQNARIQYNTDYRPAWGAV